MYLLDTNIISALRRSEINLPVAAWANSAATSDLHLSAATIMELQVGITRRARTDAAHAVRLTTWLGYVLATYRDRILPITTDIARRWGEISGSLSHNDPDHAIAATALEHDLIVVTRNVDDFIPCRVTVLNPYSGMLYRPS